MLQLRLEARKHEVYLHVFHISGDRMIACGMDGWSRGDYDAGISLGYDLRSFLPLNISAFEVKDNKLKDWCKSWMGSDYSPPLEPARTGSGRDTSLVFISGPHLQRQYW